MVLLLLAPLFVPLKMTLYPITKKEETEPLDHDDDEKTEPLIGSFEDDDEEEDDMMLLAVGEGAVKEKNRKKKRKPKRGEDFRLCEALIKADFWLLFVVFFVGVGTGVTVLNNLAQIGIAQGVQDTTILLSTFSFCNFVGRLGGGVVSEHFVR